jgi:hypothetical protein
VIRYSRGKLEDQLDRESIVRCADELRALENSVLWFRLQQKWQGLADSTYGILGKNPLPQCEYACASGKLQMLDDVFASLEEIIVEGTKKRNE